jgi:hypothetical protein
MSQENVEIVRRAYADGDLLHATGEQIDQVLRDYLDEEFELHLPPDYPEGELVFRGRDGFSRLIGLLQDTWSEWRFEPALP